MPPRHSRGDQATSSLCSLHHPGKPDRMNTSARGVEKSAHTKGGKGGSMRGRIALVTLCAVGVSGCVYASQTAMLTPVVSPAASIQADGLSVSLRVVDERPRREFGNRTFGGSGGEINPGQDVRAVLFDAVSDGLAHLGFAPTQDEAGSKRSLKIEIREIEYRLSQGFWTVGAYTNAAIKAIARRGGDLYENFYRADSEARAAAAPSAHKNEQYINVVVNDVLNQLFADQELFRFLAKRDYP